MAAVIGAGLLGTTGEAGLLHFRGAFHNPLMTLPVTLPPVGRHAHGVGSAGRSRPRSSVHALVDAVVGGDGIRRRRASTLMAFPGTWAAGATGARISSMGRPLPAPPSFAGLALAGLAALGLMDDHPDA